MEVPLVVEIFRNVFLFILLLFYLFVLVCTVCGFWFGVVLRCTLLVCFVRINCDFCGRCLFRFSLVSSG